MSTEEKESIELAQYKQLHQEKVSWIWKKEIALTTTHKSLVHITNAGYNTDA